MRVQSEFNQSVSGDSVIRPTVVVDLAGKREQFVLDTGAEQTVVAQSYAATDSGLTTIRTNLPVVTGISCREKASLARQMDWRLGTLPLATSTVASIALPRGTGGLLGSGTLESLSPIVLDLTDGSLFYGSGRTRARRA